ncbi:MAG: virulence RhuM family protein [Culturomica sp.]|nr:virulence RhuM family protein [Culturomica sp.]
MNTQNEMILYRPNDVVQLEVRIDHETVWLTQAQMVLLFGRDQSVISKHIGNVFKEKELDAESNMQNLHITNIDRPVSFYSLDVIISVGYRVKSVQGTLFRQWANRVLKEYLLRGYAINRRFEQIDNTLSRHEQQLSEHQKQIDFVVRTALPPKEGIFFEGQIFDAYLFVSDLIKSAKKTILLLDNYIDETVLLLLSKRQAKVGATIYTKQISAQLQLDLTKHNAQYTPITINESTVFHDRFLLIDTAVYHLGASLKDLGKKLFAFSKMEIMPAELLKNIT